MPYITGCWARFKSIKAILFPDLTPFNNYSSYQMNSVPLGRNWPNKSLSSVCEEKNILSSGCTPKSYIGRSVRINKGKLKSLTILIASREISSKWFFSPIYDTGTCDLINLIIYYFICMSLVSTISPIIKFTPSIANILKLQ